MDFGKVSKLKKIGYVFNEGKRDHLKLYLVCLQEKFEARILNYQGGLGRTRRGSIRSDSRGPHTLVKVPGKYTEFWAGTATTIPHITTVPF